MKGAASGYRLIIGILAIILCALLWIPLNTVFGTAGEALNSMVTDPDVINLNNTIMTAYYYTLAIIIIAIIIYIVKPSTGQQEAGEVIYVPMQ